MFHGTVSVWEDDGVRKMASGDGCTAIPVYLTLLSCNA
jgi:hypothetical protein